MSGGPVLLQLKPYPSDAAFQHAKFVCRSSTEVDDAGAVARTIGDPDDHATALIRQADAHETAEGQRPMRCCQAVLLIARSVAHSSTLPLWPAIPTGSARLPPGCRTLVVGSVQRATRTRSLVGETIIKAGDRGRRPFSAARKSERGVGRRAASPDRRTVWAIPRRHACTGRKFPGRRRGARAAVTPEWRGQDGTGQQDGERYACDHPLRFFQCRIQRTTIPRRGA